MRSAIILLLLCPASARPEIIDRVVASAGSQVVTESSVYRQAQMAALLNGETTRLDAASRRRIAEQLVDQALVRRVIDQSRFEPVSRQETEQQVAHIQQTLGLDDDALRARLAQLGLTSDELFQEAQWQLTLFRFIDFRFRPGVQVSDQEVSVYYDGEYAGMMSRAGKPRPPLDEVRDDIISLLTERKIQGSMDQWLEQLRQQVRVRYREEAFK